jgi:Circularly permutated YpsA SLOG family
VKLISGGQTGVDRAALDVALKHGIDCGGWCPAGRFDEFGRIPDRYPLKELEQGSFADRTFRNVKDSDATIVIYCDELRGGTEFTVECCEQLKRPKLLIDAATNSAEEAAVAALDFVREHKIKVLNIAGPRQSDWSEGYEYASRVLDILLTRA